MTTAPQSTQHTTSSHADAPHTGGAPQKSFLLTWLFAHFLGTLGIDRFYLGKIGTGVAKLLTCGGLGIWALIDLVMVLLGKTVDSEGRPLEGYEQHKKLAWIVSGALILAGVVFGIIAGIASASMTAATYTY